MMTSFSETKLKNMCKIFQIQIILIFVISVPSSVCVRECKAPGLYLTVIEFQGPWADLWFIQELEGKG